MSTEQLLSAHVYTAAEQFLGKLPGNYLEIGVFNGVCTAQLGRNFESKIIYAIDPFIEDGYTLGASHVAQGQSMPNQRDACHKNIDGLENVVLFEMTSKEFADILTDEMISDMDISWVTIDGSHHYDDVTVDYKLAMRLIGSRQGVIVFDDMAHIGVRRAYYEFMAEYADRINPVGGEIYLADGGARVVIVNGV
jgi:predicted O-methyltransferase YrrM